MLTTHLTAKQMLLEGYGIDAAWAVAQQDEGLLPHVTKQDWLRFMSKLIDAETHASKAHAYDPNNY